MMKRFVFETLRNYGPPLQWPFLSLEALVGVFRNLHDPVFHGRNIRYGDGKPLLLVPGHLAGDVTLLPFTMWLRAIGYRPTQLGVPINWDDRLLDNSLAAALPGAARLIGRKAVIVAFGTGVRTALRVAALDHDHVSDVIALGLPDQLPPIPEGVRLHVVGRMPSQSDAQGERRVVEGSESSAAHQPECTPGCLRDSSTNSHLAARKQRRRDPGSIPAGLFEPSRPVKPSMTEFHSRISRLLVSDCRSDKAKPLA